jgi:hypothetical protein
VLVPVDLDVEHPALPQVAFAIVEVAASAVAQDVAFGE